MYNSGIPRTSFHATFDTNYTSMSRNILELGSVEKETSDWYFVVFNRRLEISFNDKMFHISVGSTFVDIINYLYAYLLLLFVKNSWLTIFDHQNLD